MATLGDLLASARRDAGAFEGWISRTDPDLASELGRAAEALRLEPAGFVRLAVSDYSRLAEEEDWASLVSALREATDPAMTCLSAMVRWRIGAAACAVHGTATVEGTRQ